MKRINLEYLILEVLEEELNSDNEFLSAGEIAFRVGGILFKEGIRRNSPITTAMIKNRMSPVRQNALTNGFIVTAQRLKHLKNGGSSLKTIGWKIATEEDSEYVKSDLEINQFLRNGQGKTILAINKIARREGIMSPNDLPKLSE